MKGRPQDFADIGIIQFMAFPEVMKGEGPVLETLSRLLEDDYFQVVEVTSVKAPSVRAKAVEMAKQSGKKIAFGGQPQMLMGKLDLNSLDASARRMGVDRAKACVDEAYEWGAVGAAFLTGPDPGDEQRSKAKAFLVESLKELCNYSASKGSMPVLLETFDRVSFGKNCLLGPTAEAADLASKVCQEYPNFGLMVDLSHLPLLGETPEQMISDAGEYLRHVHIGNCVMRDASHPAYGDNHPMFGIPEGEVGAELLAEFLGVLIKRDYMKEGGHNIVSFEVKPFGDQTSEPVIKNACETLDKAWQML